MMPWNQAVKLVATEAGFAAGQKLLDNHIANCEVLRLLPEIKVALDDIRAVKKARLWLHWVGGGICGGALFALGEQLVNAATKHFGG
jgi:hypothetical protein